MRTLEITKMLTAFGNLQTPKTVQNRKKTNRFSLSFPPNQQCQRPRTRSRHHRIANLQVPAARGGTASSAALIASVQSKPVPSSVDFVQSVEHFAAGRPWLLNDFLGSTRSTSELEHSNPKLPLLSMRNSHYFNRIHTRPSCKAPGILYLRLVLR